MVNHGGSLILILNMSLRYLELINVILTFSVDVFNFLQPVLENNLNNDMSVAKIVETCRQEVSFFLILLMQKHPVPLSQTLLSDVKLHFEILWYCYRKAT